MWRAHDLNPGFLKPGARYTQSDWFINNKLLNNRSELQRAAAYQINKDLRCARGDANTEIRWAIRSTKNHLTNRVEELSLWQNQSEDSIALVDKEITGLEQVKTQAEQVLQDGCVYRLLLGECVALRDGRGAGELVHDHVEAGLRREVELMEEMKEQTQKNLLILLDQLRDLRNMRALLTADERDKGQAAELNGRCLSFNLHSPNLGYKYQPCQVAKGTVSYSQWTSHCRELKQTAEKLALLCGQFRGTMQYNLSKLMSALETQRCATDFSLRRRVKELSRAKESLDWERQQVEDAVVELVRDKQKVELQVMTSGSEQQVAHTCLDILAQRPNQELCMDQPHVGLLLENMNLSRNTYVLKKKLALSERTLEALYRNLMTLDEHLASKARALDIDRQCLDTRRRLVPLRGTVVVNGHGQQPQAAGLSSRLQVSPPGSRSLLQAPGLSSRLQVSPPGSRSLLQVPGLSSPAVLLSETAVRSRPRTLLGQGVCFRTHL